MDFNSAMNLVGGNNVSNVNVGQIPAKILQNFDLAQIDGRDVIPSKDGKLSLVRMTSEIGYDVAANHQSSILGSHLLKKFHYLLVENYE